MMTDKNRPWGIHTIHDMIGDPNCNASADGRSWRRAVPEPYHGRRLLKAWWVLTGRAEAVVWPQLGEFEAAANLPELKR